MRTRIGDWSFDPDLRELERGSTRVRLEPKHAAVLSLLAARGEVVSKEEILDDVWQDVHVTEEVLTNAIYTLRRGLGDDARHPRYIETIPRKGYRLVASVRGESPEPPTIPVAPRFAKSVLSGSVAAAVALSLMAGLVLADLAGREDDGRVRQARILLSTTQREDALAALAFCDEATRQKPEDAVAWATLAEVHLSLLEGSRSGTSAGAAAAKAAAWRAIDLDPRLASPHVTLGLLHLLDWEWRDAEARLRHATGLEPENARAHAALAELALFAGRRDDARRHVRQALDLEPDDIATLSTAGFVFTMLRDAGAAREAYRHLLALQPENAGATAQLAKLESRARPVDGEDGLADEIERLVRSGKARPAILAGMFAEAGDDEKAIRWLRQARDEKDMSLLLVRLDDRWERLHADPRVREIFAGVGP